MLLVLAIHVRGLDPPTVPVDAAEKQSFRNSETSPGSTTFAALLRGDLLSVKKKKSCTTTAKTINEPGPFSTDGRLFDRTRRAHRHTRLDGKPADRRAPPCNAGARNPSKDGRVLTVAHDEQIGVCLAGVRVWSLRRRPTRRLIPESVRVPGRLERNDG